MFLRAKVSKNSSPIDVSKRRFHVANRTLAIFTELQQPKSKREKAGQFLTLLLGQTCAQLYFTALGAAINFPGTEQYFSGTDHTLTTTTQFAAA